MRGIKNLVALVELLEEIESSPDRKTIDKGGEYFIMNNGEKCYY